MWLLIVITTFWTHGAGSYASVYSFQEFDTEARCLQIKKWIDDRQNDGTPHQKVETQCLLKEGVK